MGNESSAPRNLDKQKARLQNKERFAREIDAFRQQRSPRRPSSSTGTGSPQNGGSSGGPGSTGISVVCRKRPRFEREFEKEYDAVSCYVEEGVVVAHDGRMRPNMRDIQVSHVEFRFDQVFDEQDDTKAVYDRARVSSLVESVVLQTSNAYLMMFGQTGSGKTHTMRGVHLCVAEELFARLNALVGTAEYPQTAPEVFLSVFEIGGERCTDLLGTASNCGAEQLKLQEKNGEVHVSNLTEHKVRNAGELLGGVDAANRNRATAATGVHDHSSRSHALYGVKLVFPKGGPSTTFWLVDLAGSEWSKDSAEHDSLRRVEGAQINKSLLALKECIRIRQKGQKDAHMPYRQSALTKVLKGCFVDPKARTVVICTVSPCGSDTEHTQCTLSHAAMMDGQKELKRDAGASLGITTNPAAAVRRESKVGSACSSNNMITAHSNTAANIHGEQATPRVPPTSARRGSGVPAAGVPQPIPITNMITNMQNEGKENLQQQQSTEAHRGSGMNMNGHGGPSNRFSSSAKASAENMKKFPGGVTGGRGLGENGSVSPVEGIDSDGGRSSGRASTNAPASGPFSPAKRQKSTSLSSGGGAGCTSPQKSGRGAVEPAFLQQHPSRWTAEEVQVWWDWAWRRSGAPHPNAKCPAAPKGIDGKGLARLSKQRLIQLCNDDQGPGERMYAMLKCQMQDADALKRKQVLARKQNIGPGGKEIIPRIGVWEEERRGGC